VKNGAELLDRLIKDIVSESAASYVSVLEVPAEFEGGDKDVLDDPSAHFPTAFSLPRFIPLLRERIWVINPFTRNFLVGWLTLLDSIPDLELVTYLPDFLGGLLKFLGDQNADVRASTQTCLDKFLNEIKRISRVKKGILDAKRLKEGGKRKRQDSMDSDSGHVGLEEGDEVDSDAVLDDERDDLDEDWIPGQDVEINYKEILEILTSSLDSPLGTLGSVVLLHPACLRAVLMSCRGGLLTGIPSMDCRVPRNLPGRGPALHTQDTGSHAPGHGQH
jgi:vacuole morphology and inheritance protein 14